MASIKELSDRLESAIAEFEMKSQNYEQALADEREAGKRDRDGEVADLNAMVAQKEQEKIDFGASEYARGFADGVASVVVVDPPPIDPELQAKLDAALVKISELEATVVAMQSQLADMQSQLDAKSQELVQFKASELEKIKAIEVDFQV